MARHGKLNRIFRLVWSRVRCCWVAVAETTRGRGKGSRSRLLALPLSLAAGMAVAAPQGGQVVAGAGGIVQSGATTTINQSSQNLSLSWQSFNVAAQESVNFVQPSASAIAINRIQDVNGSQILGRLNANGQVFLINPNGILFGQGAQVNVGGLVASTLDINDASGAIKTFAGPGAGSVVNHGAISAADGGYVALLGNQVNNQGTISAPLGSVALGGGNTVTLTFADNSLLAMQVDSSVLNSLADNGGLLSADGGRVLMSAGARDSVLASVVNNSGVIEAHTVENRDGTIVLLGGMRAGTTRVSGTLDASAPTGGDGGFIETSAAHIKIEDSARITTAAAHGNTGEWLIDPVDFTIAAAGGDISGAVLSTALGLSDVVIESGAGSSGIDGDIHVNDTVSWSANELTLSAHRNININIAMNGSGSAALALEYGQGAVAAGNTATVNINAPVNLPSGNSFSRKLGSDGAAAQYAVINDVAALQAINNDLAGNYALGSNIDAAATSGWNGAAGFAPIGAGSSFTGNFDGLGHTVSNLVINRPSSSEVGLISRTAAGSTVQNMGVMGGSIAGRDSTGALVGTNHGTIINGFASAVVMGGSYVGGLIGENRGSVQSSYATGNVSSSGGTHTHTGGLVGGNETGGSISGSYASGNVSGRDNVGGLVGFAMSGTSINHSYATGNVSGTGAATGGLLGYSFISSINNSYAMGSVSGNSVGGLVGNGIASSINNSYWNIETTGQPFSLGGTGLTTAQLQATLPTGFSSAIWGNAGNQTTPYLLNNPGPVLIANDPGATYYTILLNLYQLQNVSAGLAGNYALGNDIDAGATSAWNAGAGFVPLGSDSTPFTGRFDGLGHTISNLTINRPDADQVGLFGFALGAQIHNTGVVDTVIDGRNQVGALLGSTVVSNATGNYSSGLVSGQQGVGGLIGYNNSSVVSSSYSASNVSGTNNVGGFTGETNGGMNSFFNYATGTVNGSGNNIGGLVGYNGTAFGIIDSYATGTVSGVDAVGGLVGYHLDGGISSSYASGAVTGSSNVGGLIGFTDSGMVNSSFWNSETSGLSLSAGGTAINSAQMMTGSTFAGWDIATTGGSGSAWRIYEGHTGPLLTTFLTNLVLADTTLTYTSAIQSGSAIDGLLGAAASGRNVGAYQSGYYSSQQGFDLSGGNLTIDAAAISLSGTRTYDGTGDVVASIFTLNGLLGGQDLILSGNGTIASKNVGSYSVNLDSLALSDGSNGLASNYTFTGGTHTATIDKADLLVSGLTASNKIYDATTTATLGGSATVAGLGSDDVFVIGIGSGQFADKNVGTGKTITVSGNTLGGIDAGNYNLVQQSGLSAAISKADLLVSGLTASNKIYDATTTATLGGSATVAGLGSDDVFVTGIGSGQFADKNVGTGKTITVSGNSLDGADAGNYNIVQQSGLSADISRATLTYVATPSAFFSGQAPGLLTGEVTGLVAGETLADATNGAPLWIGSATLDSPPGLYAINGSGLTADNYQFVQAAGNASALTLLPGSATPAVRDLTAPLTSILSQTSGLQSKMANATQPVDLLPDSSAGDGGSGDDAGVAGSATTRIGTMGPPLQIVSGGVSLPSGAVIINE